MTDRPDTSTWPLSRDPSGGLPPAPEGTDGDHLTDQMLGVAIRNSTGDAASTEPPTVNRIKARLVHWPTVTDQAAHDVLLGAAHELLLQAADGPTGPTSALWFTDACRGAATQPRSRWDVTIPALRAVVEGFQAGWPESGVHGLAVEVAALIDQAHQGLVSPAGLTNVLDGWVHWGWLGDKLSAEVMEAAARSIPLARMWDLDRAMTACVDAYAGDNQVVQRARAILTDRRTLEQPTYRPHHPRRPTLGDGGRGLA